VVVDDWCRVRVWRVNSTWSAGKPGRQLLIAAHSLELFMTARKLVQPFPPFTPDTDAMEAAQTMAAQRRLS
jgi:hypothetical protein